MAEGIWERGKLYMVMHLIGYRTNGDEKYRRANFDLLMWQKPGANSADLYVIPNLGDRFPSRDAELKDEQTGMEFGYYDSEVIYTELHEGDGRQDSWRSLHCFGYV